MGAGTLLLLAALLLMLAAAAMMWGQRAEQRRGKAAAAVVDQHRLRTVQRAGMPGLDASQSVDPFGERLETFQAVPSRGAVTAAGSEAASDGKSEAKAQRAARREERRKQWAQWRQRPFMAWPRAESVFLRAGVAAPLRWLTLCGAAVLLAGLLAAAFSNVIVGALVTGIGMAVMAFRLWAKIAKRRKRVVRQLPVFIDLLIRQVTVGTSLGSAFQSVVPQTAAPLGEILGRAVQLTRAGVELDNAVKQTARLYGIEQLLMIGAVLGVSVRFGGRSDQVLERIAGFMRDVEQARDELVAMSSETRLSAWILGLLPLAVAVFLMLFNNAFFMRMWNDPLGADMLIAAAALQGVGSICLYRLAKSV